MKTRAGAELRSRLRHWRVIGWTTTNMTDPDANTITRLPVDRDSHEDVAHVAEVVVQSHDHRRHTGEIWNTADVLNCEGILNVIAIFGRGRDVRRGLTGKECEVTRKQHHTRPVINAQRN